MNRFSPKYGAIALVALASVYLLISLATGHSAASERPPDLSAPESGVNVWEATALLARNQGGVAVVDARPSEHFTLYHLPGSISKPGARASEVSEAGRGKAVVLVVAETDAKASKLTAEVAAVAKNSKVHFLKDGVRGWFLTYAVPVPLFNEKPPPYGWRDAMATARKFVDEGKGEPDAVLRAAEALSRAGYTPTQLQGTKKAATGEKKKKIAGGCG